MKVFYCDRVFSENASKGCNMSKRHLINCLLTSLSNSVSIDLNIILEVSSRQLTFTSLPFLKNSFSPKESIKRNNFTENSYCLKNGRFFRRNECRQFKVKRFT